MTSLTQDQWWAWLAGLFEGEGTIDVRSKPPLRMHLRVKMTDEDVIRRAQSVAGVGRVYGPYNYPSNEPGRQDVWIWAVYRRDEAAAVLRRIYPFLGERRSARVAEALAFCAANPAKENEPLREGRPHISRSPPSRRSYRIDGCRCDDCRAFQAAAVAAWRTRRKTIGIVETG
jgi:hypothetical protein